MSRNVLMLAMLGVGAVGIMVGLPLLPYLRQACARPLAMLSGMLSRRQLAKYIVPIFCFCGLVQYAATKAKWTDPDTNYTWSYVVRGNEAEIYLPSNVLTPPPAISPFPDGFVAIPEVLGGAPVTRIGNLAFISCTDMAGVSIPDTVSSIGHEAFLWCSTLTELTIPSSVTNIGNAAFCSCTGLTNIVFEGNAPEMGCNVFENVASGCCAYVRRDSTGWGVDIPGTWQGIRIEYFGPPPPEVRNVAVRQRYPWNGKVDITCQVTGIDGATNGLDFAVSAVYLDDGIARAVSHFEVVGNGTVSAGKEVHTNGDYRIVWDARADLGEVVYSNMAVRVTLDGHKRVQLWDGGPYWAETNVGAEKPEDYGYYFWWGDTVGYKCVGDAWVANGRSSSSFRFSADNTSTYDKSADTLKSEGRITAEGVLAPAHDAAHVKWGGSWRMPTHDELSALNNNCDWTWTTTNGVNGYIVRGRDDYASASIFLPAVGRVYGTSLGDAGSVGFYWSSVPYSGNYYSSTSSRNLCFSSDVHETAFDYRFGGCAVRPVQGFTEAQMTPMAPAGDSAPLLLDMRTGVRESSGEEALAYSSLWDGNDDPGATVTIAQDGVAIAEGLTGDGDYAWSVTRNGTYELTHTTYTNGVAGVVETATFVVTGKDVPYCYGIVFDPGVENAEWSMERQSIELGKVAKLNRCTFTAPAGKRFAGWRRKDNGRRYDDGILVFNLASEPGAVITMEAVWEDVPK